MAEYTFAFHKLTDKELVKEFTKHDNSLPLDNILSDTKFKNIIAKVGFNDELNDYFMGYVTPDEVIMVIKNVTHLCSYHSFI